MVASCSVLSHGTYEIKDATGESVVHLILKYPGSRKLAVTLLYLLVKKALDGPLRLIDRIGFFPGQS